MFAKKTHFAKIGIQDIYIHTFMSVSSSSVTFHLVVIHDGAAD